MKSLWWIPAPLLVWAAHFLLCYGTVAIVCAKHITAFHYTLACAAYTLLAAAVLIGITRVAYVRRSHFLGYVTISLVALSGLAILYSLSAALLLRRC